MAGKKKTDVDLVNCWYCVFHVNGICNAYPDGIPSDIYDGDVGHFSVRDDQNGDFVFTQITPESEDV